VAFGGGGWFFTDVDRRRGREAGSKHMETWGEKRLLLNRGSWDSKRPQQCRGAGPASWLVLLSTVEMG